MNSKVEKVDYLKGFYTGRIINVQLVHLAVDTSYWELGELRCGGQEGLVTQLGEDTALLPAHRLRMNECNYVSELHPGMAFTVFSKIPFGESGECTGETEFHLLGSPSPSTGRQSR
jgi:hypothetical protein